VIQPYSYSGTLGILGFLGMGERFFNRMGAAGLERTICTAAGAAGLAAAFGRVFYSTLAQIEKVADPASMRVDASLFSARSTRA
jgi:hypothetical protein